MVIRRSLQAILSFLALGGFFAVEFMRGRSVDLLAPVICSWVAIVAPVLLAILWVIKKQYIRTFVLAVLVTATRISLGDSLSEFMKVAAWFLIGAIVLVLIVALAARWLRGGGAPESRVVPRRVSPRRQVAKSAKRRSPVRPCGGLRCPGDAHDARPGTDGE